MMGSQVPPPVQHGKISQACRVCRICRGQIESETESFKILPKVVEIRIPLVESPVGSDLLLNQQLKPRSYSCNDELCAFCVEIAAEALEVRAEQHHVSAE